MLFEILALVSAVIEFIIALRNQGKTPETIIKETSNRFMLSEAIIRSLVRFIK